MRTGVVIAGGRATRFGDADKAVADLAGTPMIRRVAERVAPAVDEVVVNCRRAQRDRIEGALAGLDPEPSYAVDREPDRGPMAGIREGLRAAGGEYACVVACDMPFVDGGFLEYLFERAEGRDAAVPRLEDRWYQTTQAVYRAAAMADACEAALERGDRKILAPLEELDYVVVDEDEVLEHTTRRTFENVNTREELAAAAEALADEG